jgi:hypothetical protein
MGKMLIIVGNAYIKENDPAFSLILIMLSRIKKSKYKMMVVAKWLKYAPDRGQLGLLTI